MPSPNACSNPNKRNPMPQLGHLQVGPAGKYIVVLSTRIEGETEDLSALAVAKRELSAALPLLKPAKKLLAEISRVCEPAPDQAAEGLHVLSSCDETILFAGVAAEAQRVLHRIAADEL